MFLTKKKKLEKKTIWWWIFFENVQHLLSLNHQKLTNKKKMYPSNRATIMYAWDCSALEIFFSQMFFHFSNSNELHSNTIRYMVIFWFPLFTIRNFVNYKSLSARMDFFFYALVTWNDFLTFKARSHYNK